MAIRLKLRNVLGRNPACDVRVEHPSVSREHAVIHWADGQWWLRDLGSRNGSRVDGRTVQPGQPIAIARATVLHLGSVRLTLTDNEAPGAVARGPAGDVFAEGGLLCLGEEQPASVFRSPTGRWLLEDASAVRPVSNGDTVHADGIPYELMLPLALATTEQTGDRGWTFADLELRFKVSADLEEIRLRAHSPTTIMDLGARAHHHLLWVLAQQRSRDLAAGIARSDQGWVHAHDLPRMTRMTVNTIYSHIFRARRQLSEAGVAGAMNLIERRAATQQIRLGSDRIRFE